MNKLRKNGKGITLIALVVTILVLLILAAVSINMLTGENGIIRQAQKAKEQTEQAKKDEENRLEQMEELFGEVKKVEDSTPGDMAGEGTEKNPYLIESIEDLIMFAESVSEGNSYEGKVVKLKQSLDFESENSYADYTNTELFGDYNDDGNITGIKEEAIDKTQRGFKSIGKIVDTNTNYFFEGTFDGNNKKIMNVHIRIVNDEIDTIGLFAGNLGAITNLGLTGNISVVSEKYVTVGGIVGINQANIENCLTDISFDINANCNIRRGWWNCWKND